MNTDINKYLIFRKCTSKTAQSPKIFKKCELGFAFRSILLSTALSLPGYGLLQYVSVEIDAFRC